MFARPEDKAKNKPAPRGDLSQFGFVDMKFDGDMAVDDDDGDDADFEAELLALTGASPAKRKPVKEVRGVVPQAVLDKMVADSMKDDSGDDDDDSVDEDDPDLLNELRGLASDDDEADVTTACPPERPPRAATANVAAVQISIQLLEERLKMYQTAEANAKAAGEALRARRFSRGVKTLTDLLKGARAGKLVKEEDIPPPVSVRSAAKPETAGSEGDVVKPAAPSRPAPPPPLPPRPSPPQASTPPEEKTPEEKETPSPVTPPKFDPEVIAKLEERRGQYRQAAVAAKRANNIEAAKKYAIVVKRFDIVIAGVKEGQPADLSEMPPPPSEVEPSPPPKSPPPKPVEQSEHQQSGPATDSTPQPAPAQEEKPKTMLDKLTVYMEIYRKQESAAKAENNGAKARRMGRIIKQYEDALKRHRAGKPFPAEDLPVPFGCDPFVAPEAAGPKPEPIQPEADTPPIPKVSPMPSPKPSPSPSTSSGEKSDVHTPKPNVRKSPSSRLEKQLTILLTKQKEFKVAALQAKSQGDMTQAKEYLRLAKGFDSLIQITRGGLPVDLNSLPAPPSKKEELESSFDIISTDDCVSGGDDIIHKLISDLRQQVQMCKTTRDHFKAMGDVASANRFENLAIHCHKDLLTVEHAAKSKQNVPKFHYESRVFSIVRCNTDLMDNDLELTIVQGINYNVPNSKDIDTYVRFELPWPSSEEPQKDRTVVVRNTNNPEYNAKFKLQIQRNARACVRIFKRQAVKCEVWSRGSFLRSDTLIGTVNIKLQPLESKCTLHDSFDLMEGRRAVGGKLEVMIRVRNPIVSKQVEQVTEKWLVLDN